MYVCVNASVMVPTTPVIIDCYDDLISNDLNKHVEQFLASGPHSLEEFKREINALRDVLSAISNMNDVVFFDMFELNCHDIKQGLLSRASDLKNQLVQQLANDHLQEGQTYVIVHVQCIPVYSVSST